MKYKEVTQEILDNGYCMFPSHFEITNKIVEIANTLMIDQNYKVGRAYRTDEPSHLAEDLLSLVCNKDIKEIFNTLCQNIKCQDVFITHEYKNNEMERNNWLHFDRLRCLKAMVYLTDVDEDCGPFSLVPQSHKKGYGLRNNFRSGLSYKNKSNRIKLDYPHLYETPLKLCGGKGTLILFDTDVFHKGGDVCDNKNRKLIRSHWYPNHTWREAS